MDPTTTAASVTVIIAAKDEAARIVATVSAARRIAGVELVIVVDDGSSDATARLAGEAGALVLVHPRNRGKATAMATGAKAVADRDLGDPTLSGLPRQLLFIDADLEDSAANTAVLIGPVAAGEAEMTIAILPPQSTPGGGHGFVVRLARNGIESLTGWTPTQPLSGMRCLSLEALEAGSPLARGWGVEVGLTIDVLGAGLRVVEVQLVRLSIPLRASRTTNPCPPLEVSCGGRIAMVMSASPAPTGPSSTAVLAALSSRSASMNKS